MLGTKGNVGTACGVMLTQECIVHQQLTDIGFGIILNTQIGNVILTNVASPNSMHVVCCALVNQWIIWRRCGLQS